MLVDAFGNGVKMGGIDVSGNPTIIRTDAVGRTKISHAQPPTTTGTITANAQTVYINMDSLSDVILYVSGTYAGLVFIVEQSPDSTTGTDGTWFTCLASDQTASTTAAATLTPGTNGTKAYRIAAPGAQFVRVRATTFTSGTANIAFSGSTAAGITQVTATLSSTTVSANTTPVVSATAAVAPTMFRQAAVGAKAQVKATSGRVFSYNVSNPNAAISYLHFYNVVLASVTVGTTVPVYTIAVPANNVIDGNFYPASPNMSAAIVIAATTTMAGATAPALGMDVSMLYA